MSVTKAPSHGLACIALFAACHAPSWAADVSAGAKIAASGGSQGAAACASCHGTNGHAQPGMESLAGGNKDDMLKKLMDFKSGAKPATIMHQLAKGYSDEQLAAIVGWFAAQKK